MSTIPSPAPLSAGGHLQPHFDEIQLLPPAGQERLRLLRQRRADAHAVVPPFEEIHQASMAKVAATSALKRLTSHPAESGFNLPPDDRRVIEAQRLLDKMTADFKRLQELQTVRTASFQAVAGALANVETWLRDGRPGNTTLEAVEIEPPKLNKGESILDGIERLRRRVRELRADHHRVASAPYLSSYCKARVREQIEALAQRGAPDVSTLVEHDRDVAFATISLRSQVLSEPRALAFAEVTDTLALFAWLHRDALIERLDAELDAEADDAASLTHEVRKQREAEVMADLLAAERDECSLVWAAQSQGLPIEFRADCSAQAILGVKVLVATRADAAAETSPWYSWPMRR